MWRRARFTARSWSCSEERASSPSSTMTPTLAEFALEQPVAALELLRAGLRDRAGAGRPVDARVDRTVGLAGAARDGGDQRAALVAQALAGLVACLRLGRGERRERRRRRGRGGRVGEQLQRLPGLGGLQHAVVAAGGGGADPVVVAAGAGGHHPPRLLRLGALALLGDDLSLGLLLERVVALLLDLRGELLEARVGREEEVAHLLARCRRPAHEAADDLAEEQLGAGG